MLLVWCHLLTVYILYSETVFSAAALNANLQNQTHEHNFMINFLNIDTALLNEKIKIYKL